MIEREQTQNVVEKLDNEVQESFVYLSHCRSMKKQYTDIGNI